MTQCSCREASHITPLNSALCQSRCKSDPLSTDQGYDTDSQQPLDLMCVHQSHQKKRITRSEAIGEDKSSLTNSEYASESDREVQRINSTIHNSTIHVERCRNCKTSSMVIRDRDNSASRCASTTATIRAARSRTLRKKPNETDQTSPAAETRLKYSFR